MYLRQYAPDDLRKDHHIDIEALNVTIGFFKNNIAFMKVTNYRDHQRYNETSKNSRNYTLAQRSVYIIGDSAFNHNHC